VLASCCPRKKIDLASIQHYRYFVSLVTDYEERSLPRKVSDSLGGEAGLGAAHRTVCRPITLSRSPHSCGTMRHRNTPVAVAGLGIP
jgi:hypothetical protein